MCYEATWASLRHHPKPVWFDDAKFGSYCYWGPYSVPAYDNEWYSRNLYIKGCKAHEHHLSFNDHVLRADGIGIPELLEGILPLFVLDTYIDSPLVMMQAVKRDRLEPSIETSYRTAFGFCEVENHPVVTRLAK